MQAIVDAETRYSLEPLDAATPELLYDRPRATAVLDTVRQQFRTEYER